MTTAPMLNETEQDERRWKTVEARDRGSDGRFVFAVVTTGIYCRPSCPSRRPRRENVRFFPAPEEAEEAGFRACLRCKPQQAEAADPSLEKVEAAREHLERHLDETVTLEQLAEAAGCSPWHLQRTFRKVLGLTPRQYVNARRLERLRPRLRAEGDVTTALYDAGFGAASQLYGQSDARLGMTPGRYRKGGEGVEIRFATARSAVGWVLVAATPKGVCAVKLGEEEDALEEELRQEFPRAAVEPEAADLGPWIEEVLRRIEGQAPAARPPLDLGGTAFQRRVWQALAEIPRGEKRTYAQVAAGLGSPNAARAVARACATNPAAVVVPCHRVVPAAGGVGGYRWGEERKRELLAREAEGG